MSGVLSATFGGSKSYSGSSTVTVGYLQLTIGSSTIDFYGWLGAVPNPGSISPSTWANSGLTVDSLSYRYTSPAGTSLVTFFVNGYVPNYGWTTMDIAGISYSRAAASYSYDGTTTLWYWDASVTGNPFGTTVGATKAVTWS